MPRMNFKTELNGKQTFIPERLLAHCYPHGAVPEKYHNEKVRANVLGFRPKLHHVVERSDSLRKGETILPHVSIGKGAVKKFAPTIEVAGTQKMDVSWTRDNNNRSQVLIVISGGAYGHARFVGGIMVHCDWQLNKLANNEGYENAFDFFQNFDQDGSYNILHFTPLKY